MRLLARIGSGWQSATVGVLVSLWLGLSGLLIAARGNPKVFLTKMLGRFSRSEAYQHLNASLIGFWCMHSLLVLIAILASAHLRTDVLAVVTIGPIIGSAMALVTQRWTDPDWPLFFGLNVICWGASTVVGIEYWLVKRGEVHSSRSVEQAPPAPSSERIVSAQPMIYSWRRQAGAGGWMPMEREE